LKTKSQTFGNIGQDIMIDSRRFIVVLFSLVTFLQLSPTIAAGCIDDILSFASDDYSDLKARILTARVRW
jgi:hypothetical protein